MLLTKRAHHCTIFQTLSALMTAHPINYAILHHFSVIKDNSSVFFWLKPHIVWAKIAHWSEIFGLLSWLGENSPNSSCNFWNQESVFLLTLHHFSVLGNTTLLYFSPKFYMLWTKGSDQSENSPTFNCLHEN